MSTLGVNGFKRGILAKVIWKMVPKWMRYSAKKYPVMYIVTKNTM